MSQIVLQIRLTVDDAQMDKMNLKRLRLGRQTRTGADDAMNAVGEALQHNLMFKNICVFEIKAPLSAINEQDDAIDFTHNCDPRLHP